MVFAFPIISFFPTIPIWGWLDILFTLMVLIGVLGEYEWVQKNLVRENINDICPVAIKRKKLNLFFELVLAVGVAGELACLAPSLRESSKFNRQASEANERSTVIEATNKMLSLKISSLEAINLESRKQLLQLEALVQWRTITTEQENKIISLLKPIINAYSLEASEISVQTETTDPEAVSYSTKIADVLKKCDCKVDLESGIHMRDMAVDSPKGLIFLVKQPPSNLSLHVLKTFKSANINIEKVYFQKSIGPFSRDTLTIVVWRKPEN